MCRTVPNYYFIQIPPIVAKTAYPMKGLRKRDHDITLSCSHGQFMLIKTLRKWKSNAKKISSFVSGSFSVCWGFDLRTYGFIYFDLLKLSFGIFVPWYLWFVLNFSRDENLFRLTSIPITWCLSMTINTIQNNKFYLTQLQLLIGNIIQVSAIYIFFFFIFIFSL